MHDHLKGGLLRKSDASSPNVIQLDSLPTVTVPVESLNLANSPRQEGLNDDHCRMLLESGENLPPIVIHGQSMSVIDGMHRVRAALMCGKREIDAKIFYGTSEEAFVLAVRMNIAHGLPLTRADRTAAAARIIDSHPQWSNRMIAAITGLSPGSVAEVRRRSTAQGDQSIVRIGKDGRVRPMNALTGRLRAHELLVNKPTASIRAIAREAGVSPSTVHDVRKRLRSGEEPMPERYGPRSTANPVPGGDGSPSPPRLPSARPFDRADSAATMATLMKDPSLRYNDAGRRLIRWLDGSHRGITECKEIAEQVPSHCADAVARLARDYAQAWTDFASELEKRWMQ
ncbi:ParB N-terminal domain-containing protein [Streptosporangium sp. NPDC051022]|uniref:ParB/RepB/Spo0J family partition protein n=1 Tax=Streptosporangium sp. NPDC051022 TaxID=3155752 RepID=UPI0034176568